MPDEADANKILTASPLDYWRRPLERPSTTWLNLKSKVSQNEENDIAQI